MTSNLVTSVKVDLIILYKTIFVFFTVTIATFVKVASILHTLISAEIDKFFEFFK